VIGALTAAALAAAGCGYALGPARVATDAETISLPVFDNRTFRKGVELDLARLLLSEVHARTGLRVVPEGGDLVVRGTLVAIDEDVLSLREGQRIRESADLVTAEVEIEDARHGTTLLRRTRTTERESFVPSLGESLRSARAEALRRLASDIVDRLEKR